MGTILLARHGETAWNREGYIQGWAPVSLNDRGREQARALGDRIATEYDVDRVVTSDLRRTVETARGIRRQHDRSLPLDRDRGWRERDFGVLQGLAADALFGDHPEFSVFQTGYPAVAARPEGGESLLDARERVHVATDDLAASLGPDETALVVTHGGPTKLVLGTLLGLDAPTTITDLTVHNAAVAELRVDDGVEWPGQRPSVDEVGVRAPADDGPRPPEGADGRGDSAPGGTHGDGSAPGAGTGGPAPGTGETVVPVEPESGPETVGAARYRPRFPEAVELASRPDDAHLDGALDSSLR